MANAIVVKILGNVDTGSIKMGMRLPKGATIRVTGETRDRVISYVMESKDINKVSLCTKGFGPFPLGDLEVTVVSTPE